MTPRFDKVRLRLAQLDLAGRSAAGAKTGGEIDRMRKRQQDLRDLVCGAYVQAVGPSHETLDFCRSPHAIDLIRAIVTATGKATA